jgi:hypothetical protein
MNRSVGHLLVIDQTISHYRIIEKGGANLHTVGTGGAEIPVRFISRQRRSPRKY